jgi:hypothetical protein
MLVRIVKIAQPVDMVVQRVVLIHCARVHALPAFIALRMLLILAQLVVPVVLIYSSLLVILEAQDQQRPKEVQNAPRVIFVHKGPLMLFVLLLVLPTIVEKDAVMVSQTQKLIIALPAAVVKQQCPLVITPLVLVIQTTKKKPEINKRFVNHQTIVLVAEL